MPVEISEGHLRHVVTGVLDDWVKSSDVDRQTFLNDNGMSRNLFNLFNRRELSPFDFLAGKVGWVVDSRGKDLAEIRAQVLRRVFSALELQEGWPQIGPFRAEFLDQLVGRSVKGDTIFVMSQNFSPEVDETVLAAVKRGVNFRYIFCKNQNASKYDRAFSVNVEELKALGGLVSIEMLNTSDSFVFSVNTRYVLVIRTDGDLAAYLDIRGANDQVTLQKLQSNVAHMIYDWLVDCNLFQKQ